MIQPNFEDQNIYKVGIASGDQGKKRLTDYSLLYGVKSLENPNKGAKIFLVLYNEYRPGTQISNTVIAQLEKKVKDELTERGYKERGNEGFKVPITELLASQFVALLGRICIVLLRILNRNPNRSIECPRTLAMTTSRLTREMRELSEKKS